MSVCPTILIDIFVPVKCNVEMPRLGGKSIQDKQE